MLCNKAYLELLFLYEGSNMLDDKGVQVDGWLQGSTHCTIYPIHWSRSSFQTKNCHRTLRCQLFFPHHSLHSPPSSLTLCSTPPLPTPTPTTLHSALHSLLLALPLPLLTSFYTLHFPPLLSPFTPTPHFHVPLHTTLFDQSFQLTKKACFFLLHQSLLLVNCLWWCDLQYNQCRREEGRRWII